MELENSIKERKHREKNIKKAIPVRYVFTVLGFLGFFTTFAQRVSLTVAIVAMVKEYNKLNLPSSDDVIACPELVHNLTYDDSEQITSLRTKGEFDWDSHMQGLVLGSIFYGCVVTLIPGGIIAKKYSAKWTFGLGILISSIMSVLTPLAARWSVWALLFARLIEGMGQGVVYPAMNALIGHWAPKMERSRISSIIYTGTYIGIVVSLALSGVMCDSEFLGGWPSVFYVFGILGCIWFILWSFFVSDFPDTHPHISEQELQHIRQGQDKTQTRKLPIPWRSIFTSGPVWIIIVSHFGQAWAFHTTSTALPLYLANILHFNLMENGLISSLPNLLNSFFAVISSVFADKIRENDLLSINTNRKIFNSIGTFGMAICLLIVPFMGCKSILIVVLLSIARGINGTIYSGFMVTHVDMSPEFAGILFGLTCCIGSFSGFLMPSYAGWLMQNGQTVERWGAVFITASGMLFITGTLYNTFASAELQPWGQDAQSSTDATDSNAIEMNNRKQGNNHNFNSTKS